MASYALIDGYLEIVSHRLAHRDDATDLRDELADHLIESTDRAVGSGVDAESAQRSTLDRFGDPHIVAVALAAVPEKGIDMVQWLGRSAGTLSLVSAVLWIAVIFGGPFGLADYLDSTWSTGEYVAQSVVQALTVLTSGLALLGMNLRSFPRPDALTAVVAVAGLIAFLVSYLFAWAFMGWSMFLAVGFAMVGLRLRAARAAVKAHEPAAVA